jgi:Uma2 family endonuclease
MSTFLPTIDHLDFDAFIAAYGEKDVRYEMYDGEVFAMSGGSENHSLVSVNALVALRQRVKPRGCQTHGPDLYVRPDDDNRSAMSPDVYVRCGPPLPKGQRYAGDPMIVVEVLSPSTMYFDRGEKLHRYQKFDSLEHVIILYQDEHRAEIWTRPPQGSIETDVDGNLLWTHTVAHGLGSSLTLSALDDETIGLDEFYDGVTLAA